MRAQTVTELCVTNGAGIRTERECIWTNKRRESIRQLMLRKLLKLVKRIRRCIRACTICAQPMHAHTHTLTHTQVRHAYENAKKRIGKVDIRIMMLFKQFAKGRRKKTIEHRESWKTVRNRSQIVCVRVCVSVLRVAEQCVIFIYWSI